MKARLGRATGGTARTLSSASTPETARTLAPYKAATVGVRLSIRTQCRSTRLPSAEGGDGVGPVLEDELEVRVVL